MKAVVFDFDGTITHNSQNIWQLTWQCLGFDTGEGSLCDNLYKRFASGEYSYQKWCDITCKIFRKKGFTQEKMADNSACIKVMKGFRETIETLDNEDIKLFILSGSIVDSIRQVIGEDERFFTNIMANKFNFDESGIIESIKTTKFDYAGKAEYIRMIMKKYNFKAKDICFVGNGDNDEWVYQTGCNTICINPDGANAANKKIWHKTIEKTDDFRDLLPLLGIDKEKEYA